MGYDCPLVAQHLINPIREDLDQLETWTACAALAEATERIEIIAAIRPSLFHPVVAAKMALQIEEISRERFAINFVNAWFRPELEQAGIEFREQRARHTPRSAPTAARRRGWSATMTPWRSASATSMTPA